MEKVDTESHPAPVDQSLSHAIDDRILTRDFMLTCVGGFILFSSFLLLLGILPLYLKDDLGGSDGEVGLIIGVFAFAALFPRPFIGREIDRGGSKRFLIAGALIFIVASLLYLVATTIPLLLGVRVLHGLGMACFQAFTFIAELAPPHRRGEAMGIWGMMSTIATAVAPYGGLLLRDAWGDQVVFVAGALCAASALGLITLVREPRREVSASGAGDGGLIEPSVFTPATIVLLVTLVYGAVQSFVLLYADEQGIEGKGLYFTAFAVAVFLSRLFGGRLADRRGRWAVVLPSLALIVVAMLVLSMAGNLALLLLVGGLFGLAFGAAQPALTALAIDLVPPARRGAGMATFTSAFEAGIGSGSIVMGLVAAEAGYASMFALCTVFPAIALLIGLRRRATPFGLAG
jgi:predicted MFS family arabinose efflux permease